MDLIESVKDIIKGFVKKDGIFIAMKGSNYQEEVENANKAIKTLGGKIDKISHHELPKNKGTRVFLTL